MPRILLPERMPEGEASWRTPVQEPALQEVPRRADPRVGPFVKWAGGKTRLLPMLLPYVPAGIRNYYEPFLGGGAMFFATRQRVAGWSYLSDLNEELVNTWRAVQTRPTELHQALETYHAQDSEAFYYRVRAERPRGELERAARFIYLNQTAWNGLWRVNKTGEFNVPWGARPFRGFNRQQLEQFQTTLVRTSIDSQDFRASLDGAEAGDFVYLDPPYLPVSDTSKFCFYTEQRFRTPDLGDLANLCAQLSARGVNWVLSNRDTPQVRELFSRAAITRLTARRSVGAQNRRDVEPIDSPEVIIAGVDHGRATR